MAGPGGKEVGRVSIRVIPDATKFRNDLKLLLKRAEQSMTANLKVSADTRGAEADIRRTVKAMNGQTVTINADLDRGRITEQIAVMTRPRDITIRPQIATASAAKVASFFAAFSGARLAGDLTQGLGRQLSNLDRSLPKITAISFGIVALTSALISGIGGVGAFAVALSQLGGIALALPAAFGAIGFSVASLLTAFSGVGAALKQITGGGRRGGGGGGGGVSSATSAAQQARALQSAEVALTRAQREAKDAQDNLTQARVDAVKALRDLSNSVVDAQLSERQATVDLSQAQDDYNSVMADPSATQRQREQAAITLEQARQGLIEQRQRVQDLKDEQAKANAAGVDGADNVKQATQQLTDSQQGVVEAQNSILNLQEQNAAAAGASAAAASGVVDAMAKLTPAAQSAVRALARVWAMLGTVRAVVQENFFAGFSAPLLALADTLIPQLRSGMGAIATQLGGLFQGLMGALNSALGGGVLDAMLQATAQGLANLGPGIQPLIDAFATLGTVGVQYLPQLGAAISTIAGQFSAFVQEAAASGALKQWIDTAIAGFAQVGSVIGSAAQIFTGLFGNLGDSTPLATFAALLQRVADVVNTPTFQTALQTLFDGAAAGMAGLASALAPIGNAIAALAPTIAGIMSSVGNVLGQVLTSIATVLATPEFATGLQTLFAGLLIGVTALLPALPALGSAFASVMGFVGQFASVLGPVLGAVIGALAPVIGQLLEAIAPLIPILGEALVGAVQAIAPVFTQLAATILPPLVGLISQLIPLLVPIIQAILPVIMALLPPIMAVIQALLPILAPILSLLTPILGLLAQVLIPALAPLTISLQMIGAVLTILANIISGVLGTAITWIVAALTGDFSGAIRDTQKIWTDVWNNIVRAFSTVVGFITTAIGSVGDHIHQVFSGIADFMGTVFQNALSLVRGPLNGIIGLVNGAIRGLNKLHVDIPDWVPIVGGQSWGLNLPTIPSLALGATVNATPGGTLVRLAEAGRAETVVDTGRVNQLIAMTNALLERGATQTAGGGAVINVSTMQNQDPRILGRQIGREFLNALAGAGG